MGWRFQSADDREQVIGLIVAEAKDRSVMLTPPDLAQLPEMFRRADGTSRFRPHHSTIYSSADLLAAEDRLLELSRLTDAPIVGADRVARAASTEDGQHLLSESQADALAKVSTSGRQLDLLVGPAGAGKTTAMHALQRAWRAEHGRDSVVGLAPSAVAAQVLAEDLGIECENTAKWLHEYDRGRVAIARRPTRDHRRGDPRRHPDA